MSPDVMAEAEFRTDLYRGTAPFYDRFRPPYPPALVSDLVERAGVTGRGRALDLACGTGQISVAVHGHFDEVLAVDQEPEMVAFVEGKAAQAGIGNIRCRACSAEELSLVDGSLELVAVGNAFHRLQRDIVAAHALRWLEPGRCLALVWSDTPWRGDAEWQRVMSAGIERWMVRVRAHQRVPPGLDQVRSQRPDRTVLQESGFELVGSFVFPTPHRWTVDTLIGFVHSTSILSREALGDDAERFEEDLRSALHDCEQRGALEQTIPVAYELARRPI